jgi:hypothetical protein
MASNTPPSSNKSEHAPISAEEWLAVSLSLLLLFLNPVDFGTSARALRKILAVTAALATL